MRNAWRTCPTSGPCTQMRPQDESGPLTRPLLAPCGVPLSVKTWLSSGASFLTDGGFTWILCRGVCGVVLGTSNGCGVTTLCRSGHQIFVWNILPWLWTGNAALHRNLAVAVDRAQPCIGRNYFFSVYDTDVLDRGVARWTSVDVAVCLLLLPLRLVWLLLPVPSSL